MNEPTVISVHRYLWMTLRALHTLNQPTIPFVVMGAAISQGRFTEEETAPLRSARGSEALVDRIGWALWWLKLIGLAHDDDGDDWHVTPEGWKITSPDEIPTEPSLDASNPPEWATHLLSRIDALAFQSVSHIITNMMTMAGFEDFKAVNGWLGDDNGPPGLGGAAWPAKSVTERPTVFLAQWDRDVVRASEIRDLRTQFADVRGTRAYITTSTFDREAKQTAADSPAIELIDGIRLCELLLRHRIMVDVEDTGTPKVDDDWFDQAEAIDREEEEQHQ